MKYHFFADKDNNTIDSKQENTVRVSRIIKGGQDISKDWIDTESEKRTKVQEQVQKAKQENINKHRAP